MRESMVSIIIPTYNRRDLLPKAVESCFAQDYPALEIIIVDDGSTDGTGVFVEKHLQGDWKDRGIRYIFQSNGGASSARNHGLSVAQGDYVQFLDSDDELLAGKLQKQLAVLEDPANSKHQMCYCFGRMGESVDSDCQRIGVEANSTEELLTYLASRTTHVMQTSAPLWLRDFLLAGEGWRTEIGFGDDLEYYVRLVARLDKFLFLGEDLFLVREHFSSRLSADGMTRDSLICAIRTQQSIYKTLCEAGYRNDSTMDAFAGAVRIVYANCLQYGRREDVEAFEDWLKSVGSGEPAFRELLRLVLFRRLVGARFLMGLHRIVTKLR